RDMSVRLQGDAELDLSSGAVVEPTPPERGIDDPRSLRGAVRLRTEARPPIRAGRNDHAGRDLERFVEVLELRDVIPFKVLSRLGARVEGRGEDAPVLHTVVEIRDVRRPEFEKELSDAPAFGPWLKRHVEIGFSNPDAGNEAERGLEIVTDLLPAERNVPTIVRIVDDESAGGVSRTGRFIVGPKHI